GEETMSSRVHFGVLVAAACAALALGCRSRETAPSESVAVSVAAVTATDAAADSGSCTTVAGLAWRDYGPPTNWQDFGQTFATPFSFAIPSALPVTVGNAGNKDAVITINDGNKHPQIKCHYLGGSSVPHPTA